MRVIVITPPAPIVSYEEAVARLRLAGGVGDDADAEAIVAAATERADVEAMIAAATGHIDGPDGWLGRAIGPQTIEAVLDGFEECRNGSIFLPYRPVIEVLAVTYADPAGTTQTLDAGAYELLGHEMVPAWRTSWPATRGSRGGVRVRYRAGYERDGNPAVPEPIKAAVLLMVGDLYQNTESTSVMANTAEIPMATTVTNLLAPFRVWQ